MEDKRWMIYGATGYTGRLVAEEAAARGHRPLLAGRDESKLAALADRLGLDYRVLRLDNGPVLAQGVKDVALVLHCAGPFTATSAPMLGACLAAGAHYLDITGEIPVFENTFAFDGLAKKRGLALISGCGFDVIPTDCLAVDVAGQVPEAANLEIAVAVRSYGNPSAGTAKSMVEIATQGGVVLRDGALASLPLGQGGKTMRFPQGMRLVIPVPLGDLVTAHRSTGIPNITTYVRVSPATARLARWTYPVLHALLQVKAFRRLAQGIMGKAAKGPSQHARETGRAIIGARADNAQGQVSEGWLETPEGYEFTRIATVRCVEKVLDGELAGALSPAQAFGADFVLEIPGVRRVDAPPDPA